MGLEPTTYCFARELLYPLSYGGMTDSVLRLLIIAYTLPEMEDQMLIHDLNPLPNLPDVYRQGEPLPSGIIGARIIGFGSAPRSSELEGGGLVIDYVPKGKKETLRVVLSFTELGMWITESAALTTGPEAHAKT